LGEHEKPMSSYRLQEAIRSWRALPPNERLRRNLEAIPRRVANSMTMAGEPVDEARIREHLERRIRELGLLKPTPESAPCDPDPKWRPRARNEVTGLG